MTDITIIPTKP